MGVDRTGHMEFCPPDDDPVVPAVDNMDILIRVRLIRGAFGPVTFRVCHGPHHHQVFILDIGQPLLESFKIVGSVLLVNLIGHRVGGIDPVVAHAPLKAGSGLLPQHTKELDLLEQVLDVLMDMGETADRPAGEV